MIRLYLLLTGVIAVALGLAILLLPGPFYAGYGITATGTNLLNELRSHGLFLAATGAFIGFGCLQPRVTTLSLKVGSTFYLCYGGSRLVAALFDGVPGTSLVAVGAAELAIGLAGLILVASTQRSPAS